MCTIFEFTIKCEFSPADKQYQFKFIRSLQGMIKDLHFEDENLPTTAKFKLDKQKIIHLKQTQSNFNNFVEGLGAIKDDHLPEVIKKWAYTSSMDTINSNKIKSICEIRVEKMIKNRKIKKNWSSEDILLLVWVIGKYIDQKQIKVLDLSEFDWKCIASLIPGTTAESCQFRWLNLHKNKLSSHQWRQEESLILAQIVASKKTFHWKQLAQQLYQLNQDKNKVFRTAKQCREHWACYLSPGLRKGPWKEEEDILLMREIIRNKGNKKWSTMVKKFEGRTENALKNRYNLLIEKQNLRAHQEKNQVEVCKEFLSQKGIDFSDVKIEEQVSETEEKNIEELEIQNGDSELSVIIKQEEESINEEKLREQILKGEKKNFQTPYFHYWYRQNLSEQFNKA